MPAVRAFWNGQNIYLEGEEGAGYSLHPNMPFIVILLTPLAHMSVGAMTLTLNLAKVLAVLASLWMVADLAGHHRQRIPDWVLALGLLWSYSAILADFQHGNTNIFVLLLVVTHLWAYRRGSDIGAGAALAAAVCLKMTPAIFVLYWLYQRNGRLISATVAALVVFAVIVPAATVGVDRYAELTGTWLDKLILPGLFKGAWYPIHINQSLSGLMSRLFLAGPEGDAFYNPDDYVQYGTHPMSGHITAVALSPIAVKWLVRAGQVLIVAAIAWGIGWRKLPRTDGRRMLHYGLVAMGMLLLNQRTWHHHATVMLLASVAVWQAIAYGLMRRTVRACCLWATIGVGVITWITASDAFKLYARLTGDADAYGNFTIGRKTLRFGELWADLADAYGPQFWVFLITLIVAVVLARALRRGDSPYADQRQRLNPSRPVPPA